MFCTNCGTKNPDSAKFCAACGKTMTVQTSAGTERNIEAKAHEPVQQAPAQAQSVAGAAVNSAAAAATATAATAAASTGVSAAGYVAGAAAVGAVKKTMSTGKKFAIAGIVLALVLTVFTAYFTYFVQTPDEVVEKFFDCYSGGDINGMMDCVEPSFGNQVDSMLGLGSSILDMAGIGIDLSDIIGIAPMLSGYMDYPDYNPGNFEVVSYSGDKLSGFLEEFGHKWKAVGNAIGEEAEVECDIDNISGGIVTGISSGASRVRVRFRVVNCGDDGWRLPEDLVVEYVRDVR